MGYSTSILLLLAVSGALSQSPPTGNFFNCLRSGIDCTPGAGTCDTTDGLGCDCDTGFNSLLDYHCVADADFSTTCADANFCQNGGECRVVAGTDTCFCDQIYEGTNCENPRIELDCGATGMTVTVRPHGTFTGAMYAKNLASDTNCVLAAGAGTEYSTTFAYDAVEVTNCGVTRTDVLDAVTTAKTGDMYKIFVIVQYETNPNILMGTDQELEATCTFSINNEITANIFQTDATNNLDAGTGDADGAPLTLSVLDSTPAEVAAAATVAVGEALTIRVALNTNPSYVSMLIDSCVASNMEDDADPNYASLNLVESGGCPSDTPVVTGDHAVTNPLPADTVTAVDIPIQAFAFRLNLQADGTNTMVLQCTINLCDTAADTSGDCNAPDPTTCTGSHTGGLGRRKRSAEGEFVTLSRRLTVRFGNETVTEESGIGSDQTGMETDTGKCLKNPEMQTVISVLGVLLLALIIAVIVLTFIVCRRSRYSGKQVDDSHTMGSSTQTLSMHIPRPHV